MLAPYIMARSMFDEVFDSAFNSHSASNMMKTDIKDNGQAYELVIDLPGVKKENLSAELKDGYLSISATIDQNQDNDGEKVRYLRRERFVGSFRRGFYVGERLKQEDIRAKFEDGTLHLLIPKETRISQAEPKNLIAIEG